MGLTEYGHIATEETQLRVADLLQAIAAGSAGPEYTDATFKALLDDTNTTEIFSAWWPLSEASNDSKYKRLLRFFTMLQTDKTYTVKFPSPAVSTNPAGTPADDLAGKSAAALATDSTNPEDWAAEDRMTWYIRANAVSLADGTMDVLAIEGEEEFDITGTLAPVYTFAPALLRRVIDDGSYLSKSWRSTLADGFTPYAENVAPNGKRRAMTWHATFPGGLNAKGALTSGAGLPVANFNSATTGLALARKQTAYDSVWGDCDSLYMLDMWQLRHFNLENSRILEGCTNYNLQYKVAAAETGVKRVLLTASQASGFIVGSTVSVGDKAGNSSADRYNTWMRDIADKVKVKSIETVTVGGTDYSAVNLDVADSFDVPETAYISSMPWHSGATETLPGHSDGAPGSLTNGKYPCRWAGVEMLNGAYVIGLDPLWNVTTVDGGVTYVYASRHPRRRGNPGKHCSGFFRLVEVRRSMGRPGESPDCRGAPGRNGRFYGRNHGGLTHMSKYYTTARLLYRLHKITADQVWAYTESDPPKITEDEALAICGPRAKDETAGS